MLRCPNCGAGSLKTIAAILDQPVIEKILTHLGLDQQPPPRGARARRGRISPPEPRRPGRQKTSPQAPGCSARPQPGQRRATRQRGTI